MSHNRIPSRGSAREKRPSKLSPSLRLLALALLALVALAARGAPVRGLPTALERADVVQLYLPLLPNHYPGAQVVRIVDGDTIDVLIDGQRVRVRYIGIDTPEQGEPFYGEATEANRQLVQGQTVILVRDVTDLDRWDRLLRYVYREDGTFVNEELVRLGWARAYNVPPNERYRDLFAERERQAREARRGIWSVPQPTPTPTSTGPTPTPTSAPTPTTTPPAPGDVVIRTVFYDGLIPWAESDEYAEITNTGQTAVNLAGWRLNAGNTGQDFWFPDFVFQPGQVCRVYTDELHPEHCGFSFESGKALWNNNGDCGHLYDQRGVEVSRYCYP